MGKSQTLSRKFNYKMDENKTEQKEVLDWIQEVLEEPLPSGDFAEVLKDGVILCRLMNKIVPGAIKKFKQKGPAFLLMENIQAFLAAIKNMVYLTKKFFRLLTFLKAETLPK